MNTATAPLKIALVGNPNCGKTSLFNRLTGSKQKVANYAGVTVEKKFGEFTLANGTTVEVLDLPGAYSLNATSPDEAITREVCLGQNQQEQPDLLVCVVDATNLRLNLHLALELISLGRPMLLVLNMMDDVKRRCIKINIEKLSCELGIPVVPAIAIKPNGANLLLEALQQPLPTPPKALPVEKIHKNVAYETDIKAINPKDNHLHHVVKAILKDTVYMPAATDARDDKLDRIFLHPVAGLAILVVILFLVFQAVFTWAAPLQDGIEYVLGALGSWLGDHISSPLLKGLVVDGIVAGVAGVLVFLPQILLLFLFILLLEESGYLPRAAFLLDRLMYKSGLSGRAFIPLLSSFACAIPGIMATRSINDPKDRWVTILIAPLMTCSARLPVYTLLIAAFIPHISLFGFLNLQGLILFGLYLAGIVSALCVAKIVQWFTKSKSEHALIMELPSYRIPSPQSIALGLLERCKIFIYRVGTTILALSIFIWFLCTYPQPPQHAVLPAIDYSFAGQLGHFIQPLFAPIGFNWQICVALIPGMAAREVVVSALATVYAVSGSSKIESALTFLLHQQWSLATACAVLAWFVFAPQCISTLATVKRETGSKKTVLIMLTYLFGLAYVAAWCTFHVVSYLTAA